MRQRLAVAAAVGIVVLVVQGGSPASAATTVTVDNAGVASPIVASGTQVTITNNYTSTIVIGSTDLSVGGTSCAMPSSPTCDITVGSSVTFDIAVGTSNSYVGFYVSGNTLNSATLYVYYSSGSRSSAGSGTSGPPQVLQQIGVQSAGCVSVVRPDLDWSGIASGGWSQSWAQWMNNGLGGEVCTRTIVYDAATSGWSVG